MCRRTDGEMQISSLTRRDPHPERTMVVTNRPASRFQGADLALLGAVVVVLAVTAAALLVGW